MKIVHFAKFYPPEYGGIESVTEALAKDHAATGHHVDVVCFTRNSTRIDRSGRLTLHRIKAQAEKSSQPLAIGYLRLCTRVAKGADVVHVHTPNVLAALAVMLLPKHLQVVVHWHADIEEKGVLGVMVRPLERAMLRRANAIISTSEAYTLGSKPLASFVNKIVVIPLGISDVDVHSVAVNNSKPYILFVGRLVPYKGLPILLQAVKFLRNDAELRIVGVGPLGTELKEQAENLEISDRVRFMGRVGEDELQRIIADAAVFCLPSINRKEAFGVVLLEAMRAGRAIVATNIPGSGVSWVNSSGINVPVNDPTALAHAINQLLENEDLMIKYGRNARKRYEKEFIREVMSSRVLEVYKRLIKPN